MLGVDRIDGLDGDAASAAVLEAHTTVLRAQAEEFHLAAHWADLHSGAALEDERRRAGRRVLPGMERARRLGRTAPRPWRSSRRWSSACWQAWGTWRQTTTSAMR